MTCKRCGQPKENHAAVRSAHEVGTRYEVPPILICPTSIYQDAVAEPKTVAQAPAAPVSQPKPEVKPENKEIQR